MCCPATPRSQASVASATYNRKEVYNATLLDSISISAKDLSLDSLEKGGPLATVARKLASKSRISDALERACSCARSAAENKGRDIIVLDMRKITPIYDFMVIATGASRRQMHAIAEEVDDVMAEAGDRRHGIEGYESSRWIVQDYGDVVVHVFDPGARELTMHSKNSGQTRRGSIGNVSRCVGRLGSSRGSNANHWDISRSYLKQPNHQTI